MSSAKSSSSLRRRRLPGRAQEARGARADLARGLALAKNTAQIQTLFALANLWMARRHLMAVRGRVRPVGTKRPQLGFICFVSSPHNAGSCPQCAPAHRRR
ncbi:hypothetical protein CKO37_09835 [Rubrivivax gelatinosus]|nr:hypothetical protein [Rubrivivax gelatinosus]